MGCICGPIVENFSKEKLQLSQEEIDEMNQLNLASVSIDIKFNESVDKDHRSPSKSTKTK